MSKPSLQTEEEWFAAARELKDPAERAAFLKEVCGDDTICFTKLEQLLKADAIADGFFAEGARGVSGAISEAPLTEQPGTRIGRYKLLQLLGEGGCGAVYMAEQQECVRRLVAVKIIKLGMDTKNVVARFEAERQALALMDHPNIARVLDAGATDTGRPFFVMELVRGLKITQYCDQNHLSMRARLDLLTQVCHAVQHAHQKGIIHRDLKPSNILVTINDGVAVPKVIDFGIAKATQGRLTDATLFTAFGQFLGTPAYMSPEQAVMTSVDIDTRTDIYSLGVLLYELITGKTPFDTQQLLAAGLDELRRTIREKEPERPSTRLRGMVHEELTTTAMLRRSEVPELSNLLCGDLDWIVMKCLEKDRARRYPTANGLASDIVRYLNNEPILARPPSKAYRFQKFVRRNRVIFIGGTALAAILVLAAIVSFGAALRAKRAEREQFRLRSEAERAQAKAEAQERIARQESYANAMLLANESLESSDIGAANDLVKKAAEFAVSTATNSPLSLAPWEWRYLKRQIRDEATAVLAECEGTVQCLALSDDGQWLAAGAKVDQVLLWHLPEQKPFRQWHCGDEVTALAFSPGGARLAIGTRGSHVQVLSTPSGEDLMWFKQDREDDRIITLRFSTDGKRLGFAAGFGYSIANLDDQLTLQLPNQRRWAWHAAFSSDLQLVTMNPQGLAFSQSGTNAIPAAIGNVFRKQEFALSPDGLWLAVPLADHSIEIWSVKDQDRFRQLLGHTTDVDALAWSPDSRFLASGGSDQTVMIWYARGGTLLRKWRGHQRAITALAFSGQDLTVYSGSEDKTVRVWKTSAAKPPPDSISLPIADNLEQVRLCPGAHFFQLDIGQGLRIFQVGPSPHMFHTAHLRGGPLYGVSPDGQTALGVEVSTGQCEVWRRDRAGLFHFTEGGGQGLANPRTLSFSQDGQRVALLDAKGTLGIWQIEPWRELARWERADPNSQGLFFDPPGRRVFAIGTEKELMTGDLDRPGIFNLRSPVHAGLIISAAISPDNRFLATGAGNFVHIWAFAPGEEPRVVATLEDQKTDIRALAFSPDGQRLAFGMLDGQIQIWDFEHRTKVAVLRGHKQPVWQMGFNPDDDSLVSVSPDEMRVWRVAHEKTFAP